MDIWGDRIQFLKQIVELEKKNGDSDKTLAQDEDEVNMKERNYKITKNKHIHAR